MCLKASFWRETILAFYKVFKKYRRCNGNTSFILFAFMWKKISKWYILVHVNSLLALFIFMMVYTQDTLIYNYIVAKPIEVIIFIWLWVVWKLCFSLYDRILFIAILIFSASIKPNDWLLRHVFPCLYESN